MTSVRSRLLAAATTLVVAGAAVLGGSAAATAVPAPLTITQTNPTADANTNLQFQVTREPHCNVDGATYSVWVHPTGSSWEDHEYGQGGLGLSTNTAVFTVPAIGMGNSVHIEVDVALDCDGETQNASIDVTPQAPPAASAIFQGIVHQANGLGGLESPEGATAALLRVADGADGTPVATSPVDPDWGGFELTVPGDGEQYVVRVTSPGYPIVYYTAGIDIGAWSTTSFASATALTSATAPGDRVPVFIPRPWAYDGEDTVTGVAYGSTGSPAVGVQAILYRVDEAVLTTVDADTADADGVFELTAPVTAEGEEDYPYLVAVDFGDGDVRYYSADADGDDPSATDPEFATFLTPAQFDAETSYDVYAARAASGLSETDSSLICGYWDGGDESVSYDYSTPSVDWYDACATDGSVSEAETAHREDAFDGMGYVVFAVPGAGVPDRGAYDDDSFYVVTADSFSLLAEGARDVLVLWDRDVAVFDADGSPVDVDVRLERAIEGSWVSWEAEVYLAGTSTVAHDVPFYLMGDLGSDDETAWTFGDGYAVSTDGDEEEDPVLGHRYSATGGLVVEDGEGGVAIESRGTLRYAVGVFDYACWGDGLAAQALPIVATTASVFADLAPLAGVCPSWDFPVPSLVVGVEFDRTTAAPSSSPWIWKYGGTIEVEGLPAGLDFEVIDEWTSGTAPSLRIFGTPEAEGEFDFTVFLWDDYGHGSESRVTGTVELLGPQTGEPTDPVLTPQERELGLELGLEIGDQVSGAPATATAKGLQEGAGYDLVVRSTPQTLGTGTVPAGGTVTRTVTLPELEAGWHSLTFTSTWNGGGTATARVWFLVGPDGTLVEVSSTAPALADTGADAAGSVALASILLAVGLGLIALRRRTAIVRGRAA